MHRAWGCAGDGEQEQQQSAAVWDSKAGYPGVHSTGDAHCLLHQLQGWSGQSWRAEGQGPLRACLGAWFRATPSQTQKESPSAC